MVGVVVELLLLVEDEGILYSFWGWDVGGEKRLLVLVLFIICRWVSWFWWVVVGLESDREVKLDGLIKLVVLEKLMGEKLELLVKLLKLRLVEMVGVLGEKMLVMVDGLGKGVNCCWVVGDRMVGWVGVEEKDVKVGECGVIGEEKLGLYFWEGLVVKLLLVGVRIVFREGEEVVFIY